MPAIPAFWTAAVGCGDTVENGWPNRPELEEHSHAAMANAYEAGAAGPALRGLPRLTAAPV